MRIDKIKETTEFYHKSTNDNINGVFYGRKVVDGKLTDEMGMIFMVNEKKPISELTPDEILPKTIMIDEEEIKTDVIESKSELLLTVKYCDASFYTWQTLPPINNQFYPYAIGGMGCANAEKAEGIGTMGFIAVDNDTNSIVGITNSHVALNDPLICSERIIPGVISDHYDDVVKQGYMQTPNSAAIYTNSYMGKVKKYVPLSSITPNQVDATAIALTYEMFSPLESWKYVGLDTVVTECLEFATTEELDNLLSTNPDIYSTGIRTGAKGLGPVILKPYAIGGNLTTTISLSYQSQSSFKTLTFNNVQAYMAIEPSDPTTACFESSNHGDSGSAVLANIPIGGGLYKVKIIGLLFAGSSYNGAGVITFFNRIDDVAEQLNIRALDTAFLASITSTNFSQINNIEKCVIAGLSGEKYIIKDGKKYWQVGLTTSTDICQPD